MSDDFQKLEVLRKAAEKEYRDKPVERFDHAFNKVDVVDGMTFGELYDQLSKTGTLKEGITFIEFVNLFKAGQHDEYSK